MRSLDIENCHKSNFEGRCHPITGLPSLVDRYTDRASVECLHVQLCPLYNGDKQ